MKPTVWNWRAAFFPLIAAIFLTYEEVRDDWDANESTIFNKELVIGAWTVVGSLLLGTTTGNQTAEIASKTPLRTKR